MKALSLIFFGLVAARPIITSKPVIGKDFSMTCPAGPDTNQFNCKVPDVWAKGEKRKLRLTTRIFLIDEETSAENMEVDSVDYSKRATYLYKFDATDGKGNKAKQVSFALYLNDINPPVIKADICATESKGNKFFVQAGQKWELCDKSEAIDQIDGHRTIRYSIQDQKTLDWLGMHMSYAKAKTLLKSTSVGKYIVTLSASDKAGLYGRFKKDNSVHKKVIITIADTQAPTLNMHGALPTEQQCGVKYEDKGATCVDLFDTEALGNKLPTASSVSVDTTSAGIGEDQKNQVKYTCKDAAKHRANAVRVVQVVDTIKPTIKLFGNSQVEWHMGSDFHKEKDAGAGCSDMCDKTMKKKFSADVALPEGYHVAWRGKMLNARIPGTYRRSYCCYDSAGNKAEAIRTIVLVDKKAPTITLKKGDEVVAASHDGNYQDPGAKCSDFVDGRIKTVKVAMFKGQKKVSKIDLSIAGVYKMRYSCVDKAGNKAVLEKKVTVKDSKCPVITLKGGNAITLEAGYPYNDPGFTALDDIDGDITAAVRTTGNTVDTSKAFYAKRSCHEIKVTMDKMRKLDLPGVDNHDHPESGKYWITVRNGNTYKRVKVFCDMHTADGFGFTYYAVRRGLRVRPYDKTEQRQNSCGKVGMKMAVWKNEEQKMGAEFFFPRSFFVTAPKTSDNYLCSVNDHAGDKLQDMSKISHWAISDSEEGKYIVKYQVSDAFGNKACDIKYRTIVVKDTLAPVVTLHLGKTLIQNSNGGHSEIDGLKNPAATNANPWMQNLMAETSVSNAMGIPALLAAGMGVALLAYHSRAARHQTINV